MGRNAVEKSCIVFGDPFHTRMHLVVPASGPVGPWGCPSAEIGFGEFLSWLQLPRGLREEMSVVFDASSRVARVWALLDPYRGLFAAVPCQRLPRPSQVKSLSDAGLGRLEMLTKLSVSHNMLSELPDLSACR